MALGDARGVDEAAAAAKGVTRTKEDDGHLENKRRDPYDDCATEKQLRINNRSEPEDEGKQGHQLRSRPSWR